VNWIGRACRATIPMKGNHVMVNLSELTKEQIDELRFTDEEMEQVRAARSAAIVFDEDCPEVTPEEAKQFRRRADRKFH